jgi:hypothetical protein
MRVAYDLHWIVDISVSPELGLDIHITKYPLLDAQPLSVRSQNGSVERNGGQQCCRRPAKASGRCSIGSGGQEPRIDSHVYAESIAQDEVWEKEEAMNS